MCARRNETVVDDFSGRAGAPPNPQLWNYQLGGGGTDGQLEANTNSPRNASLDGDGNLAITAIKEPINIPGFGTFDYSSAALNTHGHLDFCYGTLAARIKLPAAGPGLRPAFFLLGSDFATVGWPQCGEIDIWDSALPIGGSSIHGAGGYDLPLLTPSEWAGTNTRWIGSATRSAPASTDTFSLPGPRGRCRPAQRGRSTIIRCM